MPENILH